MSVSDVTFSRNSYAYDIPTYVNMAIYAYITHIPPARVYFYSIVTFIRNSYSCRHVYEV